MIHFIKLLMGPIFLMYVVCNLQFWKLSLSFLKSKKLRPGLIFSDKDEKF